MNVAFTKPFTLSRSILRTTTFLWVVAINIPRRRSTAVCQRLFSKEAQNCLHPVATEMVLRFGIIYLPGGRTSRGFRVFPCFPGEICHVPRQCLILAPLLKIRPRQGTL